MERLTWSAAGGLAAVAALGFAGEQLWIFELLSHFRLHVAALAGLLAAAALLRRLAAPACAAALLGLALAASAGVLDGGSGTAAAASPARGAGESLRIVLANVSLANRRDDLPERLVEAHAPDVLGFLEVDDRWASVLDRALPDFPHRRVEARPHHFGLALYSRHPLVASELRFVNEEHHPALLVTLVVAGEPVDLLLAHAHPPLSARTAALRNRQIAELARLAAAAERPFVLLADLNATPWSAPFRPLIDHARLHDTRRGFGTQPTWPVPWARFGLPLDHILTSHHWHTTTRRTGPEVGSDHLPVFTELTLERSIR